MSLAYIKTDHNASLAENYESDAAVVSIEYNNIDQFLKYIEKRAFHMARLSTRSLEDAHDIVQESMYKLVQKYADKDPSAWKPLFYRILNSKITDYYRRNAVKDRVFPWRTPDVEDASDYGDSILEQGIGLLSEEPDTIMLRQQRISKLASQIQALPRRQKQAFMLRTWEGLSTRETAKAMGCSEGSVKTHYSRAMIRLRSMLEDDYDD